MTPKDGISKTRPLPRIMYLKIGPERKRFTVTALHITADVFCNIYMIKTHHSSVGKQFTFTALHCTKTTDLFRKNLIKPHHSSRASTEEVFK